MATAVRVLAISGSMRAGSWNQQLLAAALQAGRQRGAECELFDLRALALPLYDGDLEKAQGVPEGARRLRDALLGCQAVLVATPEYNGFPPPLLVNSLDWLSRLPAEGERPAGLAATALKPVALLSASPGALGGLRSLNFVRQYLAMAFAMLVLPQQFALPRADQAFDAHGALKEAGQQAAVDAVVAALLRVTTALQAVV